MKKRLAGVTLAGAILFSASPASAFSTYLTDVNTSYQSSYPDCLICHSTAAGGGIAVTNFAALYRANGLSALNIKNMDADNDGFTNGEEGLVTSNMNLAAETPFTLAVAGAADVKLANVLVTGDPLATSTPVADAYAYAGITLAAGESVAGGTGIAVTTNVLPVTLLFDTAVDAYASVFAVDTYTSTSTPLVSGVDFIVDSYGSVTINALPAGVVQPVPILTTRTAPAPTVIPTAGGTTNTTGTALPVDYEITERKAGCITGESIAGESIAGSLGGTVALLFIGIFIGRSMRQAKKMRDPLREGHREGCAQGTKDE